MAIPTPDERPDLYDGYDGRPEVSPEQAAKDKAYWDGLFAERHDPYVAELDKTRTEPKHDLRAMFAAKPGDPLFEDLCRLFDWQDCLDTPFRDPRESPGFESLPEHLKQALEAGAKRSGQPGPDAWLLDGYDGLPDGRESTVTVSPRLQQLLRERQGDGAPDAEAD